MDERMNDFKQQLQESGHKLTNQREATLKIIMDNNQHLSAEEIFMLVKKKAPEIGLATVYRTLELFSELKIVHKLNFGDGMARYELNDNSEAHHHHHLICLDCGKLEEFEDDLLCDIEKNIEQVKKFKIVDHRLSFLGYCNDCQKNKKKENL